MDKKSKQLRVKRGTWKEFKKDKEQQAIYKEHAELISKMYQQYAKA
ncbi:DUF4198 domain-containing protein [Patescibacteria group bacterium]|nr:DUF4198 domain-containing protein [Patescibacteria group bacterium]MBU4512349.1 DUF4198 domain-containing protein [Patescibacteria group bacterium]MCG2692776.1 DUF4198 domain-containing protein [Candidatus Parcubacteria bacterium]